MENLRDEANRVLFGTVAAQSWNSQRWERKQKVWTWSDFFRPAERKRVTKTLEEYQAEFYAMKRVKEGGWVN